jgi:hypothetical protein
MATVSERKSSTPEWEELLATTRERCPDVDAGAMFDPSAKRPMREWVVVTADHQDRWPALAEAALAKVR